jgi:hypothetical protein
MDGADSFRPSLPPFLSPTVFQRSAMRLPRMTTRRWMVAVAVVALLLGTAVIGHRLKRRHDYFLSRAQYHVSGEAGARAGADRELAFMMARKYPPDRVKDIMAQAQRAIAYHAFLAHEYHRAARYPWLPEPEQPFR